MTETVPKEPTEATPTSQNPLIVKLIVVDELDAFVAGKEGMQSKTIGFDPAISVKEAISKIAIKLKLVGDKKIFLLNLFFKKFSSSNLQNEESIIENYDLLKMPHDGQFDDITYMSNEKLLSDYNITSNIKLQLRKKNLPKVGPIYCKTEAGIQETIQVNLEEAASKVIQLMCAKLSEKHVIFKKKASHCKGKKIGS